MEHLATVYEKDVYPSREVSVETVYQDRITGKAIVCDVEGKIALVGNAQNSILQLPGGGVDPDEDLREGVIRECREEIGCKVVIQAEVGMIDDYRSRDGKHCLNYCYVTSVVGEKGMPEYTAEEAAIGMYTKWVSAAEALEFFESQRNQLERGEITFYNTGFNILRDYLFLQQAMPILNGHE